MSTEQINPLEAFHWEPQPAAQKLVRDVIAAFLSRLPAAAALAKRMLDETGTRFSDWVDHLSLPDSPQRRGELLAAGFVGRPMDGAPHPFVQERGMFPAILLQEEEHISVAIKVESIVDFASANSVRLVTPDAPISQYRRLLVAKREDVSLWAVERHGWRGYTRPAIDDVRRGKWLQNLERFRTRERDFPEDFVGITQANRLAELAIADLGADLACDLFFYSEREYWQRRNRAGRAQKGRQDQLGMGWGNHDHHTYRSSRRQFSALVAFFEKLGFVCRERFYAGAQAGWGAQILEQPAAGIVVFADVDLSPEELANDFAHEPLAPRRELGTVGLWCALHGEAFLQAGIHHLECQFDFDALARQLETTEGVKTMKPFTNFPHLRQAFTEGERWPVRPERVKQLLAEGKITPEQATQFFEHGAIGSHLENLERNHGFKGFNQAGVSEIIARTDPRKQNGDGKPGSNGFPTQA